MPSVMYGLTIFLSAFLLFQVQPIMGKMVLPWFGGSASVWTTCMLFFQALLLIGYLYTHWLVNQISIKLQSWLHSLLLLACLFTLPIAANEAWKPQGAENPTLQILGLLVVSIGLPYFVLSSTGPLVQSWFSRERTNAIPYRLFALSNLGSMLALLAYPLAIEPLLSLRGQSVTWSVLFFCYVLACGYLVWHHRSDLSNNKYLGTTTLQPSEIKATQKLQWNQKLLWIFLAACPSILLVADTSFLTENIAPIPLLWVAPLAVYLLSFVLCFESQGFYKRVVWVPLGALSLCLLAYLPTLGVSEWPFTLVIPLNICAFFAVCMVCHGELALKKPANQYLTAFYLMLSIGGLLGGFVGHYRGLAQGLQQEAVTKHLGRLGLPEAFPGHCFFDAQLHALHCSHKTCILAFRHWFCDWTCRGTHKRPSHQGRRRDVDGAKLLRITKSFYANQ